MFLNELGEVWTFTCGAVRSVNNSLSSSSSGPFCSSSATCQSNHKIDVVTTIFLVWPWHENLEQSFFNQRTNTLTSSAKQEALWSTGIGLWSWNCLNLSWICKNGQYIRIDNLRFIIACVQNKTYICIFTFLIKARLQHGIRKYKFCMVAKRENHLFVYFSFLSAFKLPAYCCFDNLFQIWNVDNIEQFKLSSIQRNKVVCIYDWE